MKIYVGMPAPDPTDKNSKPVLTVVEGAETRQIWPMPGSSFSWGKGGIYHGNLALAILTDYLGNEVSARPIYQRFATRKIFPLPPGQPFQLAGDQVGLAIQSIIEAEEGMDQIRSQIANMLPPVASEAIGRDAEGKIIKVEEKG